MDQPDEQGAKEPAAAPMPPAKRRKLWKIALYSLLGLLVLVLVVVGAGLLWVDVLAKKAIEYAGTRALGVPTTLDEIRLGLFSGNRMLAGFQVANPSGFKSQYFMRLDEGQIDVRLANLLEETVEIDQLTLTGIQINLVRENQTANFRTVIDNIRRFEASQPKPDAAGDGKKKFIIHEVVIRQVRVNVDLLPIGGKLTQLDVPIEELRLVDVGAESSHGENLGRITATVVRALLDAVLAKGQGILPPDMLEDLNQRLSELKPLETLKAIRANIRERREQRPPRAPREPREPLLSPDRPPGPLRQRMQERRQRRAAPDPNNKNLEPLN